MGSYYRSGNEHNQHYRENAGHLRKFSKQQFLQANCQFVVLNGHDYTIHKVDPDWPVDWDCIEEVRFKQSASTETTCPICLEPPIAAKITKCGHIYCWSCILQYLSLSDEKCIQCPICFEFVYNCDLRSVVSHSFSSYSVDNEILFKLMIRKKGCVEVEPFGIQSCNDDNKNPNQQLTTSGQHHHVNNNNNSELQSTSNENSNNDRYWSQANLVIVDPDTVIDKIVQRERDELLVRIALDKDEPAVCFVEQAVKLLDKRIDRLNNHNQQHPHGKTSHNSQFNNTTSEQNLRISYNNIKNGRNSFNNRITNEPPKNYLFYQSSDGQHIYLNPFSTKILCHQYNNLENCPTEIRAKILQMDWISMNEALRRRFRYLEHLPLTCEFRLVEIDFEKSNLISPETYKIFEEQIRKRAQERQRRRREERKREKIIQVEQDRKIYGIQPSLKINLNNNDQFPSVSDERFQNQATHSRSRLSITNEYDFSTDDEDEQDQDVEADGLGEVSHHENNLNELPSSTDQNETNQPDNNNLQASGDNQVTKGLNEEIPDNCPISNLSLSFRDIQLQEVAMMEAQAKKDKQKKWSSDNKSANVWSNKQSPSNLKQSSFAQLLVNAKTSQKQWTRNSSYAASTSTATPTINQMSNQNLRSKLQSESDDGGEELKAPPNDFRISDFINLNVKKKGKSKKPQ